MDLLQGIWGKAGWGSKPGFKWEAWGWQEPRCLAGSVAFRSVPECPVWCSLEFLPGCSSEETEDTGCGRRATVERPGAEGFLKSVDTPALPEAAAKVLCATIATNYLSREFSSGNHKFIPRLAIKFSGRKTAVREVSAHALWNCVHARQAPCSRSFCPQVQLPLGISPEVYNF